MKVLITGPWLESSSEYSCLFDHISVPAALIQPGVLRCYCPGNTPVYADTLTQDPLLITTSYMEKTLSFIFFRFKPYPNCHPTNPYNQQFLAKRFFFSTQRKSLTLLAAHPYREMQSFLYQKIRTI